MPLESTRSTHIPKTPVWILALFVFYVAGCATPADKAQKEKPKPKTPDWAKNPPDHCAVGTAKVKPNKKIARSTAASRARDSLARQLRTELEGIIKDYRSQGRASGEGFTERHSGHIHTHHDHRFRIPTTETVMEASHISKEDDPHYYVLVCTTLQGLIQSLKNQKKLSKKARKAIIKRLKKEFEDIQEPPSN